MNKEVTLINCMGEQYHNIVFDYWKNTNYKTFGYMTYKDASKNIVWFLPKNKNYLSDAIKEDSDCYSKILKTFYAI